MLSGYTLSPPSIKPTAVKSHANSSIISSDILKKPFSYGRLLLKAGDGHEKRGKPSPGSVEGQDRSTVWHRPHEKTGKPAFCFQGIFQMHFYLPLL
jgi:hypothetical protein